MVRFGRMVVRVAVAVLLLGPPAVSAGQTVAPP